MFQLACEHAQVPEELTLMGDISRRSSLPVMFNLSQFDGSPDLWKTVEEKLTAVNQEPGTWVGAPGSGSRDWSGHGLAWHGASILPSSHRGCKSCIRVGNTNGPACKTRNSGSA